jgi:hypothetical protein
MCYSNFLTCAPVNGEHLLRYHKAGFRADVRGLSGHAFFSCDSCQPETYMFVVFSTSPDPHATCYPISRECYKQWVNDPTATTASTPEMLHRLQDPDGNSLNPTWRPLRNV